MSVCSHREGQHSIKSLTQIENEMEANPKKIAGNVVYPLIVPIQETSEASMSRLRRMKALRSNGSKSVYKGLDSR